MKREVSPTMNDLAIIQKVSGRDPTSPTADGQNPASSIGGKEYMITPIV